MGEPPKSATFASRLCCRYRPQQEDLLPAHELTRQARQGLPGRRQGRRNIFFLFLRVCSFEQFQHCKRFYNCRYFEEVAEEMADDTADTRTGDYELPGSAK